MKQCSIKSRYITYRQTILCTISLAIFDVSHLFVLIFCAIPIDTFNCNDEEQYLRHMKPRIYRRHPLDRHFGRARIAGGVSKQKSHPL